MPELYDITTTERQAMNRRLGTAVISVPMSHPTYASHRHVKVDASRDKCQTSGVRSKPRGGARACGYGSQNNPAHQLSVGRDRIEM